MASKLNFVAFFKNQAVLTWIVSCPYIDLHTGIWYSIGTNLYSVNELSIVGDPKWTKGLIEAALFTLPCLNVKAITDFLQ